MKWIAPALFTLISAAPALAADERPIDSLIGREFVVEDDLAGQSFVLIRHGETIAATWRILGSGIPVVSENDYPVDVRGDSTCVFSVRVRGPRGELLGRISELKLRVGPRKDVKLYLNGVRICYYESPPRR